MDQAWLVALIAGLLGLAFGSFLNVCSLRWPPLLTIVFGIALSDARFYIIPDQCTGRSLTLYAPGS